MGIRLPGQLDAPMMCRPVESTAFVASIAEQAGHGEDGGAAQRGEAFPPGANWVLPAQ